MAEEKLSVIVAIYNEPPQIVEKCILSLDNQENVKLEIIILDQKIEIRMIL